MGGPLCEIVMFLELEAGQRLDELCASFGGPPKRAAGIRKHVINRGPPRVNPRRIVKDCHDDFHASERSSSAPYRA